ncbi:hypothetical protein FACS1894184_16540 [Clostridia bacterium]|nr:hypothetical protein FACS1894184_16540 [Clostridia bacterium]
MTAEQFEREKKYQLRLFIARQLRMNGLITNEDYGHIERRMHEKYRPIVGCSPRERLTIFTY